ncbi:MAG: hypothetical protein MZU91_13570 [Desulfosudis oleivorans]|nr:hypothetical protein [Desulfosudis oleivorans]
MGICLLMSSLGFRRGRSGGGGPAVRTGGLENSQEVDPDLRQGRGARTPAASKPTGSAPAPIGNTPTRPSARMSADWKKICAEHGKAGMQYAQKAIDLQPDKPDGYYYYGVNVGIYSDGVSIVTALAEGLEGQDPKQLREGLRDRQELPAGRADAHPWARFWSVLPLAAARPPAGLDYFREYQKAGFFDANIEAHLVLSELLIQNGRRGPPSRKREAVSRESGPVRGQLLQEVGDTAAGGDRKVIPRGKGPSSARFPTAFMWAFTKQENCSWRPLACECFTPLRSPRRSPWPVVPVPPRTRPFSK